MFNYICIFNSLFYPSIVNHVTEAMQCLHVLVTNFRRAPYRKQPRLLREYKKG